MSKNSRAAAANVALRGSGACDFTTTGELRTASGGGPALSAAFVFEALVGVREMPAGVNDNSCVFAKGYSFGVAGYDFGLVDLGGGASFGWQFRVGNNTGASLASSALAPAQVGRLHHLAVRYNGTALTLWWNGSNVASLTTAVTAGAGEFSVGNSLASPSLLNDKHAIIYDIAAIASSPTDAEMARRFADVKGARRVPASWPGYTQTHKYAVDSLILPNQSRPGVDPISLAAGSGPRFVSGRFGF